MESSLTIVIPAFNEEAAIGATLEELLPETERLGWRVIVVNDGSVDRTPQILDAFGSRIQVIQHPYNCGYGASLKTGIRAAKSTFVAIYDSDGQHHPGDLQRLWQSAPSYDMVVGVRDAASRQDILRIPGKWFLTRAANLIVGQRISDINSGLRMFRRDFILKILHLLPEGFSFTSTCTVAALKMGFFVGYVPITTRKRVGSSSVRQVRHGFMVLMLILRLVILFSPLRIFFPVSAFLAFTGVLYAAYVIFTVRLTLANGALLFILSALIIFFFGLLVDQISAMRRERHMYGD
jgi:glycosyltransferase involved in cell wall biosynthesis